MPKTLFPSALSPSSPQEQPANNARPDRAKKRVVAGHFDESVYRRLKVLFAQRGWTTQDGLSYAIYLLFEHCEPQESGPETDRS